MALCEAPMTATVVGCDRGSFETRSEGLRTVSRSRALVSRFGTGREAAVGEAPLQRTSLGVRRLTSSLGLES